MGSYTTRTRIDAPKEKVWEVLAEIGDIYKWNPGVANSYHTSDSGRGEGATRHCDLQRKGDYLKERAIDWREGEGFKIDIYETNLPIKRNVVTFKTQADGDGTIVEVSPEYDLKFGPIGALLDMLVVRGQIEKGMDDLLAGLKYHIETGELVGNEVPNG